MKMKEVCEKTGLTDRAVRLYVEEKLLEPEIIKGYMGRRALNFRQEDVAQLLDIALLRSFGFSLEQIRTIQTNPEGTDGAPANILPDGYRNLGRIDLPGQQDASFRSGCVIRE